MVRLHLLADTHEGGIGKLWQHVHRGSVVHCSSITPLPLMESILPLAARSSAGGRFPSSPAVSLATLPPLFRWRRFPRLRLRWRRLLNAAARLVLQDEPHNASGADLDGVHLVELRALADCAADIPPRWQPRAPGVFQSCRTRVFASCSGSRHRNRHRHRYLILSYLISIFSVTPATTTILLRMVQLTPYR